MLPQLRLAVLEMTHSCTRSWPRGVRGFASLDQAEPSDSENTTLPPSDGQSIPLPTKYPITVSKEAYEAYTAGSGSTEIQPTIDVPPESDPLLAYLTSHLMSDGKRHAAARRTSRMLLHLHALTRSPPLPVFREAVLLAAPSIRIISNKKGGKNVQKPIPLGEKQRTRFAIKWMLEAANQRKGRTVEERLAREALAIITGTSKDNEVLKKKEELHRLGMVNRANAPKTRI